jgi:hypothetical protein
MYPLQDIKNFWMGETRAIFQINDMRLKARLASGVAATAITAMMLIPVGLGFPRLASASALAGNVPVKVPATAAAAKAKDLIDRASRAFIARVSGTSISELWVFPTDDANAVYVCYTTSDQARHLALIEMSGERIARLLERPQRGPLPWAPYVVVVQILRDPSAQFGISPRRI